MVTRRITRRHFLLRPDEDGTLAQLYWYATAVIAAELGVEVHSVQVLSNHMHEVVTDPSGRLPRFFELRNRLLANALKCYRDWPEEVFSKTPANYARLETPAAIVDEIGYVTINCVSAGLVRTPAKWPGVKVLVDEIGRRVVRVKRPDFYFDPDSPQWPDEVELEITMPAQLVEEYGSEDAARAVLQAAVDRGVAEAHALNQQKGRGYLGAKRVLRTPFTARANSWEDFGSRIPTFAAAGDPEAAARAVAELRAFNTKYDDSWRRWKAGDRTVVFPYGTWKMWFCHGALRDPPPD